MKTIFLFPGQGSQYVGMGKELVENFTIAKDTFAEADQALGFSLTNLCFEGPEEDLKLTKFTQPAILTASIAAFRVLQSETSLKADFVAGHSLGEYSALVAANAIPFVDAVKTVNKRGEFMQTAVPEGTGAMAALVGATNENAKKICTIAIEQTQKTCELANFNGGGQIVISGHAEAVAKAIEIAEQDKKFAIRKAVPLLVSAPFHCSLMQPAAKNLAPYLDQIKYKNCTMPYIANVDAKIYSEAKDIRQNLYQQIESSVCWEQSMQSLQNLQISKAFEIGPGKVLSGLMRRIDRTIKCTAIESLDSIQKLQV